MRSRKRVRAIRRGPDGSAFQKCHNCGVSVTIALADMHECKFQENASKRVKPDDILDQPRSAFRLFVEDYMKRSKDENEIEVDKKGCEIWKSMSNKERQPYVLKAHKLDSAWMKLLKDEENEIGWADDEADSAEVGKVAKDQGYESWWTSSDYSGDVGSLCFFSDTT